jgi:hypothetical protein
MDLPSLLTGFGGGLAAGCGAFLVVTRRGKPPAGTTALPAAPIAYEAAPTPAPVGAPVGAPPEPQLRHDAGLIDFISPPAETRERRYTADDRRLAELLDASRRLSEDAETRLTRTAAEPPPERVRPPAPRPGRAVNTLLETSERLSHDAELRLSRQNQEEKQEEDG